MLCTQQYHGMAYGRVTVLLLLRGCVGAHLELAMHGIVGRVSRARLLQSYGVVRCVLMFKVLVLLGEASVIVVGTWPLMLKNALVSWSRYLLMLKVHTVVRYVLVLKVRCGTACVDVASVHHASIDTVVWYCVTSC